MKSVTIITPSIGNKHLTQCLKSVQEQTYPVKHLVVIDGKQHFDDVSFHINKCGRKLIDYVLLPENVGADGWYGHRVYASFTYLVNTDYVMYLDEDNWIDPNHVESLVNLFEIHAGLQWAFSFRKIVDENGKFICKDDCENLGYLGGTICQRHVDTSCFFIQTEIAKKVSHGWYGKFGADRQFYNLLFNNFGNHTYSGKYSLNYRLGSTLTSPPREFFLDNNKRMFEYLGNPSKCPWDKEDESERQSKTET